MGGKGFDLNAVKNRVIEVTERLLYPFSFLNVTQVTEYEDGFVMVFLRHKGSLSGAGLQVKLDVFHQGQVNHQATLANSAAGHIMTTSPHG